MLYFDKVKISPERRIEFIAKTITDLGKAIFVVGLASYFFERFPFIWRITVTILSVLFIFAGILIYPEEGGEK